MNRRAFFGSVGTLALAASSGVRAQARSTKPRNVVIHFVGMFGFVRRSDGSLLAATPGAPSMGHVEHASFVMARKGSAAATAFGLTPHLGVIPGAFDPRLTNAVTNEFVFACTRNASFEVAGRGDPAVEGVPREIAQMSRIAPGKRVRGDVAKWAEMNAALSGGQMFNETLHPDASKNWRFGQSHAQQLTDAVRYEAIGGRIRMVHGTEVRELHPTASERVELWVISAPTSMPAHPDPRRLAHSVALFDFLVDAAPVIGECPDAVGGPARDTDIPCGTKVASLGSTFVARMPWWPEFCIPGHFEM